MTTNSGSICSHFHIIETRMMWTVELSVQRRWMKTPFGRLWTSPLPIKRSYGTSPHTRSLRTKWPRLLETGRPRSVWIVTTSSRWWAIQQPTKRFVCPGSSRVLVVSLVLRTFYLTVSSWMMGMFYLLSFVWLQSLLQCWLITPFMCEWCEWQCDLQRKWLAKTLPESWIEWRAAKGKTQVTTLCTLFICAFKGLIHMQSESRFEASQTPCMETKLMNKSETQLWPRQSQSCIFVICVSSMM